MEPGMGNDDRLVGQDRQDAADTAKELNTAPPERRFKVKLIQTVEQVVEVFADVNGVPLTGNKKDALATVQNFIDDEKDLGDAEYRLEAEEIVEAPVESPAAESTE